MSVSSLKGCLRGTNNANMEETGILEKATLSGVCYLSLNQARGPRNANRPLSHRAPVGWAAVGFVSPAFLIDDPPMS